MNTWCEMVHNTFVYYIAGHMKSGGENGHIIPTENTQLMEGGRDQDLSVIKPIMSDDTRSHASAVSSHNSSHPSSSMRSASTYHKYHFPRNSLETLGLLGKLYDLEMILNF